jgi:LCP family protein required for cell wall assembly
VWGLILVVVLALAYYLTVPMFAWSKVTKVDAEPDGARPPDQPGTTYLLVGSDSREDLTEQQRQLLHTGDAAGGRADTIMLLHAGDDATVLLSIPRASLVHVPGHGTAMINSAYAYGGPELLVESVEEATGVRVDNYIDIGIGGVVDMVDTVGGITICPPAPMNDKRAGLHVERGCQHADGRTALAYARSRHAQALDDLDRATHQREVVSATGSEVFSPATFLNPARYSKVMYAGAESIRVGENVGRTDFAKFLLAMRHVAGADGLTCGMPVKGYMVNAVEWDQERAGRILDLIATDDGDQIDGSLCQPSGLAN